MSETTASLDWTRKAPRIPRFLDGRNAWPLVAGWLVVVAVFVNFVLIFWVTSGPLNMYIAQPLLWGSVGLLALWARRRKEGQILLPRDRWLIGAALLVGILHVIALLLAGFLVGFGRSPSSREPLYIALNLWFVVTRLAGIELARWHLVNALGSRRALLGGAAVSLLLTLAMLPLRAFADLRLDPWMVGFLGGTAGPVACQNVLATYLSAVGGPLASMAYVGMLQLLEWVPPYLPMPPTILALFLGAAVPAIGIMVIRDLREWRSPASSVGKAEDASGSGVSTFWIAIAAVVVFLIWFNTGVFGVRPALVAGQSMEPTLYMGDVVIARQVQAGDVKAGEIIQYRRGTYDVVHRVVAIQNEGGQTVFITKGDNNKADDPPVQPQQLQGKVVMAVPKVGWIAILPRLLLSR